MHVQQAVDPVMHSQVAKFKLITFYCSKVTTDTDENNNNNNIFLSSASCGTSPVNSNANNTDIDYIVYEVGDSNNDNITPEKPAESAQAKLSMKITLYYRGYSPLILRSPFQGLDFSNLCILQDHAPY
jgi:hypothetical protein